MTVDITYKITDAGKNHRFNYRVTAIIETNGNILIHRFLDADYSFLPGGRVKMGETAQDAILRELKEELNIDVTISSLPFIAENFFTYGDEHFHEISLFFKIDGTGLSLPENQEIRDNVQFLWCDSMTLADINLQPEFLNQELGNIPDGTKHITHHSKTSKENS